MALGGKEAAARRGFASRSATVEERERDGCAFLAREGREEAARYAAGSSAEPSRSGRRATGSSASAQRQTLQRTKRLAAVAGASVAVALASIGYGAWASASSLAAVGEATAGAVPALTAAVDIRAGELLSGDAVEVREVPQAYRSATVLGSEALEGGARRALVDIPAGTPIAASFVTGSENDGRLAAELQAGKEAVTVAVDAETGLAGHVRPYDVVRVVSVESASAGASLLETLCERARVVAVGGGAVDEGTSYASVTIEASPEEADAVREAQYAGRVSLLLLAADDALAQAPVYGASVEEAAGESSGEVDAGEAGERG